MTLKIRRALPDELAECANLVARGAKENFVWAHLGNVAAEFMANSRDEEVYVASADDQIIGVCALFRPGNFVHYLFVESGWRSRGVGGDLLAVVGSLAGGPISLKVDAENHRARDFYEREGLVAFEEGRDPDGSRWLRMGRPDSPTGRRGLRRAP
ncbi:MAG TPA: GNAT family N-acetyltransferase [Caulobacteraceae bacterium]|nr:GNAT family N-acetyltransferase [Caulobacteraceae bacterium]